MFEKGVIDVTTATTTRISNPGDRALEFLQQHSIEGSFASDKGRLRRLRRKIDYHVMPFLALAYFANYLDKILLNYANVMGLTTDLKLKGNNFSNASSALWIAVLIAEIPNIYLLQRFPTGKWLSICLIGWGIATACTAATTSYNGLLATRIFSGIFEAAVPPALMLLSGQYYTRSEQVLRFVWWYMGTAVGLIFGGLISWAFQHVSPHAALASWRIMFIALGLSTILLAVGIFLLVPDTPMQASFLTSIEKVSLLSHVKINETGIENRHFKHHQIKEAFTDWQLWGMWLIMLLEGGCGGVFTAYSSTLIKSFGYTSEQSALLNMCPGPVVIAVCFLSAYGVTRFGHRWGFLIAITIPAILGAALMAWSPHSHKSELLAGICIVYSAWAATPLIFSWMSANVAGHTKRSCATAVLNAAFAIGNIIGPQTFQAKDAPEYQPAKITLVVFQCAVILLAVMMFAYYRRVNKNRDDRCEADGENVSDAKAFSGLTDKQNLNFRYAY